MDKIFKKDDYIYFRVTKDDPDNSRKVGDIIRYSKNYLLSETLNCLDYDYFDSESVLEDGISDEEFLKRLFSPRPLKKEFQTSIRKEYIDSDELSEIVSSHKEESDFTLASFLGIDDDRVSIVLKEGEVVDFKNQGISSLFFSSRFNKLFSTTELISDPLKEKLFKEDFDNAIYETRVDYCDMSFESPNEIHYYKVNDDLKIDSPFTLAQMLDMRYFGPFNYDLIKDENDCIKYIAIINDDEDKASRQNEQKLLKICQVVPKEEALRIHEEACNEYKRKQKENHDRFFREIEEREKELDEAYQKEKNNPTLFPGTNGQFVHVYNEDDKKKEYSLEEIKSFFKRLKELNPEVVKNICFYGGTIPYILTDAKESRSFGDIDMFVPTECMEELRKEFEKQSSFKMLCDSKPLAEECILSTRITKGEDYVEKESSEEIFKSLHNYSSRNDKYIDGNGLVHTRGNEEAEKSLPYYRKVQDFGFKANLFGINISVFPIYEFNNDIMAKSFNINDMYNILLGVRVINNTELKEFVKDVQLYDASFKVLPLEFTLISKQSALDGKYINRSDKDKKDIDYINEHKAELGISDERLEKIKSNYPDYSISIAYKVDGEHTTTMGGETYKQLVLTNMHVS